MNPAAYPIPEEFESPRLTIRLPRVGDGAALHAAIVESVDILRPWMPWVHPTPTLEDEEENVRRARARFLAREDLWLLLFLKGTDTFVGGSGLHRIDWGVPKFEIGYWVRKKFEGQGYISEAVVRITEFAFETLHARRVEIRVDDRNRRSWRIPERLGFRLEGILRNEARDVEGKLRDTRVYARIRGDE